MQTCLRPRATRRLVGALVLALLCAQWIGLAHAIAHGPAEAVGVARADHGGHGGHDDHWGHDADTRVCEVLAHLLWGRAVGGARPTVSPKLHPGPAAPPRRQPAPPGAAPCPYEARGPPAQEVPRAC